MKMFLPLLALISVSMIPIAIQANSIAYYRERVQRLEAEARRMGIEDEVGFIDSYFILGKKEAYVAFQKELAASSEFILTHLDEITSNDYQIAIIAMSTWEMTRATFVAFLNAMADAVEAGKIDRKFFKWAQSPTEGRLSGLLVREYDKPDIQGIVIRSRKIFHDRPYNNDASGSLGTLGQLTKLCDWVFVGKVVDTKGNKVVAGAKEEFLGGVSVTLNWRGVTAPKGRLHLSPGQAQRSPGLWCIWPFGSVVRLNTCTVVVQKCCVPRVHFEFKAPLCVAPNRCGEDRDETQCLRGFAQNPHTQLLFLG